MKKSFHAICLLLFVLCACNENKKKSKIAIERERIESEIEYKNTEISKRNDSLGLSICNGKNVAINLDTFSGFTYELQELLIDGQDIFFISGEVFDIYRKDSIYIMEILSYSNSQNDYIAEVSVSEKMFHKIKPQLDDQNISEYGCFLFKVSNMVISDLSIRTYIDLYLDGYCETETKYSYFDLESELVYAYSKKIKLQGELIRCFLYRKLIDESNF